MKTTKPPQTKPAKKVAALKARIEAAKPHLADRLLSKVEVLAIGASLRTGGPDKDTLETSRGLKTRSSTWGLVG